MNCWNISEHMNNLDPQIDERRGATSASNAQADALCPGRHLAQKGIPEPPRSADAEHGDLIHQSLAQVADEQHSYKLSVEQRDMFDSCREIEKKIILQLFGQNNIKVWREERFWVRVPKVDNDHAITFEHSAKPDLVVRAGPQALIVDYKTLAGEVPASPKNLQLRDAVVLARGTLVVSEIAVVVIQPLVTHSPEIALYEKADIDKSEKEMFERVRKSNDPASPRIAGELQCKFCRAKASCKEYQRWSAVMVPSLHEMLNMPFAQWTPEQNGMAANALDRAFDLLMMIKGHLEASLEADPNSVPGWCLKPGNMRETITKPQEVFERFSAKGGELAQFMPAVSLGKEKLKEAMATVTGLKGIKLKKAMEELLAGLTESKQNKSSLSPKDGDA